MAVQPYTTTPLLRRPYPGPVSVAIRNVRAGLEEQHEHERAALRALSASIKADLASLDRFIERVRL